MYKEAVFQLVNALKHEQLRCGYLSSEVQAMLSVRERWLWKISKCKEGEKPPGELTSSDSMPAAYLLFLLCCAMCQIIKS